MKEYIPNPVDTGHIQLPKELEYLVEEMAKNVHEVWSKTRIEQGWTYGKKRDDVLKQHPCLVPYEELPEEEKVYDRNSSVETLKLIMKLGFKISKDEEWCPIFTVCISVLTKVLLRFYKSLSFG